MYQWVVLLLMVNLSLLAWNALFVPEHLNTNIPTTVRDIPELVMLDKAPSEAVYSSELDPAKSSCFTIGPYNNQRAAHMVLSKIRNYGLAVSMRAIKSMETLNFLVYIPAYSQRSDAEKVAQDIRKFDVNDIFIIDDGPYKNAISLGFFADLNQAKRHAEYIRYLGYDARYTEQQAAREVYWLDYDEPIGSNTPISEWSKSIDSSTQVQKIPRACQAS